MRLGYSEEARAFMGWIEQRCRELRPGKPLQVIYRIDGSRELPETVLKHFQGYQNSRPVRIGNGACHQLQLDIYGELMEAIYIYDKNGGMISYDFWRNLVSLVDWAGRNWREADKGIWEVRGRARPFLYSRVLCWVALDRGIQLARRRSYPAPLARWLRIRDEIYKEIYEHYWDPKLKSFVQFRGAKTVDASSLLMPMLRFISPSDPRWQSTLAAIENTLVEDSLVYRYRSQAASDGLPEGEGTFSMCSFWYVECLARAGDLKKARFIFEKALGYANHLGLYAEQLGRCGEHLGNFPQALSHIALISAAWTLNERLSQPDETNYDNE
jgi:GH15 family glucan-1,4-alpha-glucosidase